MQPFRSRLRQTLSTRRFHPPARLVSTHLPSRRYFHLSSSPPLLYPRKDSQDRESIITESSEYSKSGTDDAAARQEEAAFDPSQTSPEQEKETAGKEADGNPLDVSPANPDVSVPRGEEEGGAEKGVERTKTSGGGSPKKGRKVS